MKLPSQGDRYDRYMEQQRSGLIEREHNLLRYEFSEHSTAGVHALLFSGTGSPEGAVTAGVGSLFLRTDGGTGTVLYVKETGTGNTGWVAK